MRLLENSKGVNPRLYVLIALPTLLGIAHHVDHVIRGNHVDWPIVPMVNSFTYSLVVYPVIGIGFYLTVTDRVGVRYRVVVGSLGAVMMWFFHLRPWAVEPPSDIILPYTDPVVGTVAFAVLIALILSLLVTTGYATYSPRSPTDRRKSAWVQVGRMAEDGPVDPSEIGERDAPPVEEKPYKILFEANKCIGAGKCAEVSDNWDLDLETGIAAPRAYFIDAADLEENVRAAEVCPAKKDDGVIHVVDRRTSEELAPDPHGDGTLSVDW